MNITPERLELYEAGEQSPSLPEIESMALFLNIPPDYFWSDHPEIPAEPAGKSVDYGRLIALRQRIIGVLLAQARAQVNFTPKQLAEKVDLSEEQIRSFEMGEQPIPLPVLEAMILALGTDLEQFLDQKGPIKKWRLSHETLQRFQELPPEIQEFVTKPVNMPYLEVAMRLSEVTVERLRSIAEGLLEITY
ncbi:MAG: helix-turn-helix domain-containing protein [Chloroflexi bacterium]|nr:helix-turn-helix domain-containing protein [Chloroflexota bacterium]